MPCYPSCLARLALLLAGSHFTLLSLLGALAAAEPAQAPRARASVDICVYGGTSGGVIAAVEAARHGHRVLVIEPSRRLGGMSSGGLGMTDNGSTATIGGLSREFYQRIYQYYRKPEHWPYQRREDYLAWMPKIWGVDGPRMEEMQAAFVFEPRAAKAVFEQMVAEAGVEFRLGERLDLSGGVFKRGPRLDRIVMESGLEITAKVFIDASYEGDLMAKAGVSYVVGREPNSRYGETLNGSFPFTPLAFPRVSPYQVAGDPSSGLLPRIEPQPPAAKGSGDHRVQAYNFRVCLTDIPENRVPIVKPASYDRLDYELLARYIATLKGVRPGPRKHAAVGLRGNGQDLAVLFSLLPNRKTDSNSGGEFGSDMYGASYAWPEADHAARERIFQQHKDYTLGLLWFLGNDERVPVEVRTEMQRWGLPKDEFEDTGHWPHQLYVREARRMVSDYVITEHDAQDGRHAEDGVALASYPLDSHGVTLYVDDTGVLHRERGFYVGGVKPFPISYRALRPRSGECDNLLVVSCLSSTHAAYGSVRMEPVFMMVGHAAGAAASLAIQRDGQLPAVAYASLRELLLKEGQILEFIPSKASLPAPSTAATQGINDAEWAKLGQTRIVDSADYWRENAQSGRQCRGELVRDLLRRMAAHFHGSDPSFEEALTILQQQQILASPAYWTEHAARDRQCSGANVQVVLRNFLRRAFAGG
jgi:hypothetical protein